VRSPVRLWADISESERATDEDLVSAWQGMSTHYRDNERARLKSPGPCSAASAGGARPGALQGKLVPCGAPVMPGADLCAVHGGPSRPKKVPKWKQLAAQAWDRGYEAGLAGGADCNPYRDGGAPCP